MVMGLFSQTAVAGQTEITGYTAGAQVMQFTPKTAVIDELNDLVYSQIMTQRNVTPLHMSLLVPRHQALKPAIIYFPGGGFTSTDYHKFIAMRMALAKAGFVVAAVEYRVIPNTFPAPVVDGKSAVRYLRAHAKEFGIDPQRIGVLGDSAGGWLAQMLGMTNSEKSFDQGDDLDQSSDVQAVATLYGISNLLNIGEGFSEDTQKVHQSMSATEALLVNGPAFRDFVGASIGHQPEKALQASPMGHIQGPKPPFLIMHGSADSLVSPVQSVQLYDALKKQGQQVTYILVKGAEHGDIHWYQEPVIDEVVNWFKQTLGGPIKVKNSDQKSDPNANL